MNFKITYEGRQSLADVQKKFKDQLSETEILKVTAAVLNETATRVQGFIRKNIHQQYNVRQKHLARGSKIGHKAKYQPSGLYTTVEFSYKTTPLIGFGHTGTKNKQNQTIAVEIIKGKSQTFRHAFIAVMSNKLKSGEVSEHEGIYAAGRYEGKEFVYTNAKTKSGRTKLAQLKGPSFFTMFSNRNLKQPIAYYIENRMKNRLEGALQSKINKMKNN